MKANEFDARFDLGEDVTAGLDLANARHPGQEQRRVNVDFPWRAGPRSCLLHCGYPAARIQEAVVHLMYGTGHR